MKSFFFKKSILFSQSCLQFFHFSLNFNFLRFFHSFKMLNMSCSWFINFSHQLQSCLFFLSPFAILNSLGFLLFKSYQIVNEPFFSKLIGLWLFVKFLQIFCFFSSRFSFFCFFLFNSSFSLNSLLNHIFISIFFLFLSCFHDLLFK